MSILHGNNLIRNGSFEIFDPARLGGGAEWFGTTEVEGWTLGGTARTSSNWFEIVQSGHRGVASDHGRAWLDMDASAGNISISQAVEGVQAGKQYTIFVTLGASHADNGVELIWGGERVFALQNVEVGGMRTYSVVVTGHDADEQNTLTIVGTGAVNGFGVSLDDVSMVRNPDPVEPDPSVPFTIDKIHTHGDSVAEMAKFGEGSGRQFFVNFDMAKDRIAIDPALARSYAELQRKATIYQSEGSTVVEFHSGKELIVFTGMDLSKFTSSAFIFGDGSMLEPRLTGENLIRNGSFELYNAAGASSNGWGIGTSNLDGWTLGGTAQARTNWFELHTSGQRGVAASDGRHWLDLDTSPGNIRFSQNVEGVEEGRAYTLTISAASSARGEAIEIYWNGAIVGTVVPESATMRDYSFVVTGADDDNVVEFRGSGRANNVGVSLDNVRLHAHEEETLPSYVYDAAFGGGRQYVHGFLAGMDYVSVAAELFQTIEDLRAHTRIFQEGTATIVDFGNGRDELVFTNTNVADITDQNFLFNTSVLLPSTAVAGTGSDDTIVQGAGSQIIDAGAGFDVLTGGAGADSFVYRPGNGREFVVDFTVGVDRVAVDRGIAGSFEQLLAVAAIYQDGRSTQIEFADGGLVTLFGVNADQANAGWFTFI